MEEAFAMLYDIRKVICFLFRWGEHAKFVTEIAEYFGWWKMVISVGTDYWRQLRIGMKHQNHIAILVWRNGIRNDVGYRKCELEPA